MKRIIYLAGASLGALAYSHGRSETTLVQGKDGPVRVNKSDFDADQEKPAGDRQFKAHKGDDDTATARGARSDVNASGAGGVVTTAAPSAPDFSGPEGGAPTPIDETKNAAAPVSTTADQILVMKGGTDKKPRWFLADGMGNKITGAKATKLGIDENGYDTQEAASAVQTHTQPTGLKGTVPTV